jgi:hypothetical protein
MVNDSNPAAPTELPITSELQSCGVTKFAQEGSTLQLTFSDNKVLIFDVHEKGTFKTIQNLKAAAKDEKIDKATINKVAVILLNAEDRYLSFLLRGNGNINGNGNGKSKPFDSESEYSCEADNNSNNSQESQPQLQPKAKEYIVFKYSQGIPLAEEITIANANVFLQIVNYKPLISDKVDLTEQGKNIVLKPHEQGAGSPIFPYAFANTEEINLYIKQAQKETIDSLFQKHKSIWKKLVVADNEVINLLSIDSLYSHFQDKFSTTHYDLFVGGPGSGKGAILRGFKYLGYRVVAASDMSGANLLDLLSSIEPNQITLAEDELDDIHQDHDKLNIQGGL